MPSKFAMPKTLGGCADALWKTRQERMRVQKQVDALRAVEKLIEDRLIAELPKSDATGVSGKLAKVRAISTPVPIVQDWGAFYAGVHKAKAYDLFQRRLNGAAVKERWDAGKSVPGVGTFNAVKVSLTKV